MNPLQLTALAQDRAPLIAEIMPLFKLHARITNTDEDLLNERYIGAGVAAAENYLLRDVWPTTRTWLGDLMLCAYGARYAGRYTQFTGDSGHHHGFVVRRGRARTLTLVDAASNPVPPENYRLVMSADPKTWGFELAPLADLAGVTVTAATGWLTYADMPDDLQAFVLQAAAAYYEIRELANYGGGVQATSVAPVIPTYLLDSWANLTYA